MAIAKTTVPVLLSASAAPGSTKAAPGQTSSAVNCTTYYGGELTYKITNGTTQPTAACVMTFQTSHDGFNWYDYQTVAGDTTASSVNSGSILLDRGVMYVRVIAYGNNTSAVTVESILQAVTGL